MNHSREAAEAIQNPPSCLEGFGYAPLPPRRPELVAAFSVMCKSCEGDAFQILAFPLMAPNPSPYHLLNPGDTLHRPPHRLRCTACKAEAALFDARTQGYDGVLNGGCTYESGETGEAPIDGEFRVVAEFFYNIERDEMMELATEAKVKPSDLFDCLSIVGTPVNGGEEVRLDYECA